MRDFRIEIIKLTALHYTNKCKYIYDLMNTGRHLLGGLVRDIHTFFLMLNTLYQLRITHIKARLTELSQYNCCW